MLRQADRLPDGGEGVLTRRFQINPGPLRVTGQRARAEHDAGRCKEITHDGLRCLRDAEWRREYCWQHPRK